MAESDTNNSLFRKLVSLWSSVIDKTGGSTGNKWALRTTTTIATATDTPSAAVIATDTTIAAGAKWVQIITDGTFAGTVLGAAATASTIYTFQAQSGHTLGAIAITRSAGNATILKTI